MSESTANISSAKKDRRFPVASPDGDHEVLTHIDWGSEGVYDQTLQRAVAAGLVVRTLPVWHDVDRPEDLDALRVRLRNLDAAFDTPPIETAPLRRLAEHLDRLCSSSPPRKGTTS